MSRLFAVAAAAEQETVSMKGGAGLPDHNVPATTVRTSQQKEMAPCKTSMEIATLKKAGVTDWKACGSKKTATKDCAPTITDLDPEIEISNHLPEARVKASTRKGLYSIDDDVRLAAWVAQRSHCQCSGR